MVNPFTEIVEDVCDDLELVEQVQQGVVLP
jgi:hypothetical protein